MTSKLSLYNGALRLVGERRLATISENREPRRLLDDAWDDGAVDYCLEQGLWNFATRTVMLEYSPSVEPPFGYRYAFDKPEDYVRTAAVCRDEYFNDPLTQYDDSDGNFWFADLDTLYIKYISDDDAYGYNYASWPQTFTLYVQLYLANQIAPKLTQSGNKRLEFKQELKSALIDARSKDAMNEGAKFLPTGSWVRSRSGNNLRRDRARGTLIG